MSRRKPEGVESSVNFLEEEEEGRRTGEDAREKKEGKRGKETRELISVNCS